MENIWTARAYSDEEGAIKPILWWKATGDNGKEAWFSFSCWKGEWGGKASIEGAWYSGTTDHPLSNFKVTENEIEFTAGGGSTAGVGDLSDVVTDLVIQAAANYLLDIQERMCLKLQEDRQTATLLLWDQAREEWIDTGVGFTRTKIWY